MNPLQKFTLGFRKMLHVIKILMKQSSASLQGIIRSGTAEFAFSLKPELNKVNNFFDLKIFTLLHS